MFRLSPTRGGRSIFASRSLLCMQLKVSNRGGKVGGILHLLSPQRHPTQRGRRPTTRERRRRWPERRRSRAAGEGGAPGASSRSVRRRRLRPLAITPAERREGRAGAGWGRRRVPRRRRHQAGEKPAEEAGLRTVVPTEADGGEERRTRGGHKSTNRAHPPPNRAPRATESNFCFRPPNRAPPARNRARRARNRAHIVWVVWTRRGIDLLEHGPLRLATAAAAERRNARRGFFACPAVCCCWR